LDILIKELDFTQKMRKREREIFLIGPFYDFVDLSHRVVAAKR